MYMLSWVNNINVFYLIGNLQFNQVTVEDVSSPMKSLKTTKLVLEADEKSKDAIVEVHKDLICKLKPHQVEGYFLLISNVFTFAFIAKIVVRLSVV